MFLLEALYVTNKQVTTSDVIGEVRERLSEFDFLTKRRVRFYVAIV